MQRGNKGAFTSYSRRDFLKNAAAGGAGTVAALSLAGAAGTAMAEEAAEQPAEGAVAAEPKFEVINCDFLVVGSGDNGLAVIEQAIAEGYKVTVIDKGPYRQSGTSGMSWDAFSACEIADDPKADGTIQGYLGYQLNAQMLQDALEFDPWPNKVTMNVNNGQLMGDRKDDGSVGYYLDIPGYCQDQFFRREMDHVAASQQAVVYDQTMITDILVSEGKCVGVMGIYLPTGNFRIFRSPVTVLATGGCTWIYGWFTVSAYTIGTPDNTADADMACFRRGLGIGDAEYAQYDVLSAEPSALACAFGSGVCGDAQEAGAIFDKNGELVFDPTDPMVADRIYFDQVLGRVIVEEGRGTEHDGVMINVAGFPMRYANERNKPILRAFGIDPDTTAIEAVPEMYEHAGQPVIDGQMMTEIPGLFHARGAGTTGEVGGAQVHYNRIYGPWAAHCASEYLKSGAAPDMAQTDWSDAIAEYARLQEIRTRQVDDPIQPDAVRVEIQQACYQGLGVYRNAERMEAAIAEFERIRKEDMPRMCIRESSPTWNREWKMAIENYNMLDIAELSVRASLAREETRGMYLRGDFPEKDDENFACMLVGRLGEDGQIAFEKKDMPRSTWL